MKKIVALILLMLTVSGCVSQSQLFVNSSGQIIDCHSAGAGIMGIATASVAQEDCENQMRNAGFIEIEKAGVAGVTLSEHGTTIIRIAPNSPAEKSGLKVGDVVQTVNGVKVSGGADFRTVSFAEAGTVVLYTVQRGDESKTVTLTLASYTDTFGRNTKGGRIEVIHSKGE